MFDSKCHPDAARLIRFVLLSISGLLAQTSLAPLALAASRYQLVQVEESTGELSELWVEIFDETTQKPCPARVTVRDQQGTYLDAVGRGLYADGRFFVDGQFRLNSTAGRLDVTIEHGPHFEPLTISLDVPPQRRLHIKVDLHPWFLPETRGWYAGDNHVHAQHDQNATVKTDLAFAALQARANGLNFMTEAGSNVSYAQISRLSTASFLLRYAPELRPGPFVGHFNTPGISPPLTSEEYQTIVQRPLPGQALVEAVHRRGGVVTHTHPLTPPHQLHWMSAAELFSDAVLGRCADLLDVDSRHTQRLWFAALNLGNHIGVSSYTDSALGRVRTQSPGDRRVYCYAERLDDRLIITALRQSRTMATSGGPVFGFLTIDQHRPGDRSVTQSDKLVANVELQSLYPLRSAILFRNGQPLVELDVAGQVGPLHARPTLALPPGRDHWFVLRTEDSHGDWCLTSPIYFATDQSHTTPPPPAHAIVFEICNATRFVQLRPEFFAHVIATVRPGDTIASVALLRDGQPIQTFRPEDEPQVVNGQVPVTGMDGEYAPGWIFHPDRHAPQHFQADWPVTRSGWYRVEVITSNGRTYRSDELRYEASDPRSRALSIAQLVGSETRLTLWGYGEESPWANLSPPFDQAEWWYPQNAYWRLTTQFGSDATALGATETAAAHFRSATP